MAEGNCATNQTARICPFLRVIKSSSPVKAKVDSKAKKGAWRAPKHETRTKHVNHGPHLAISLGKVKIPKEKMGA